MSSIDPMYPNPSPYSEPIPPFLQKIRLNFRPPPKPQLRLQPQPQPASSVSLPVLNPKPRPDPGPNATSSTASMQFTSPTSSLATSPPPTLLGSSSNSTSAIGSVSHPSSTSAGGGASLAQTLPTSAIVGPNSLSSNPNTTTISGPTQNPPNPLYLPPPALPIVEEDLVPPENFSSVTSGVYRCGFPKKRNFKFMETLQLKTVLTLVLEDYPEANLKWCQSQDIQFMQFGIPGNKEPFDNIPEDVICSALVAILDRRNHPILIHCNKGKHRTGCLIGCIRRLQSWSLSSIFDEYRRFSLPKSRAVDQQFIDLFDISNVWSEVMSPKGGGLEYLPHWSMLTLPRQSSRLHVEPVRKQLVENTGNGISSTGDENCV